MSETCEDMGYFEVFCALLAEHRERGWVYGVVCGEPPSDAKEAVVDGFLISGSCSNMHDDEPWILTPAHLRQPHLP
jgi:hypothetical protein